MRRFKKRLKKKFMSRAAAGIGTGTITPFYAKRSQEIISHYIDYKYLTEFRPWWYSDEIFAKWSELNLGEEHKRHFDKWINEIERMYNLDFNDLNEYYKSMPKRKQNRKPRVEKPPAPIRQLKKTESFMIRMQSGIKEVMGERCLNVRGYEFMIRHDVERHWSPWVVSCITSGTVVAVHCTYKKAVQKARELVEDNFEKYEEHALRNKL